MSVGFGVPSPFPTASGDGKDEGSISNKVFCDISISADGYLAGPGQTTDKPFGDGPVDRLHAWMFDTPEENQAQVDQIVAAGAFVMGRNLFGPIRGDWDRRWQGWWGENPPYHALVFVLTHHPRPSTWRRRRQTVSTVKTSPATIPAACRRRNARQVVTVGRGVGSIPWRRSVVRIAGAEKP